MSRKSRFPIGASTVIGDADDRRAAAAARLPLACAVAGAAASPRGDDTE